MCVIAMGLTGAQETTLLPVRQRPNERVSSRQCSMLELKQASTYSSISGVKGTSLLFLADLYAGKAPKTKTLLHRRLTMVTRSA